MMLRDISRGDVNGHKSLSPFLSLIAAHFVYEMCFLYGGSLKNDAEASL